MTYAIAKQAKLALENTYEVCGKKMNTYPKGSMGLTPDSVRATSEYKLDNLSLKNAHQALRSFNKQFLKSFKAEYAAERKARFA